MDNPAYKDPDFVQGQIAALTSMVLAVAALLPKEEFAKSFAARIESLETALLSEPVAEARLAGVENLKRRVLMVLE